MSWIRILVGMAVAAACLGEMAAGPLMPALAQTYTLNTLVTFNGANGVNCDSGLTPDGNGNLFSMTESGGTDNFGTVFKFSEATHILTTIASFTTDGANPDANVTLDSQGNLFGTTAFDGTNGDGTIFEIPAGTSAITVLASFDALGNNSYAGVTLDSAGNLYGTTETGGNYSLKNGITLGTVYKLAPGANAVTTIASFDGANGGLPNGSLTIDGAGNLYGITIIGGDLTLDSGVGDGTVFEIAAGTDSITTLVTFEGANGAQPYSPLTLDSAGNLYGTTSSGGKYGFGTVFKIAAGTRAFTTLVNFKNTNGASPTGNLVLDKEGNIYGTTEEGGNLKANNGAGGGVVYKIAAGTNTLTTLWSFSGTDGYFPDSGVTLDGSGNMYGSTLFGGKSSDGTLFELVLVPAAPTIASVSPTSGPTGATVTISGTGFTGTTSVKFANRALATFTVNSDTSLSAVVPAGAQTGAVSVTNPKGTATSTTDFVVTPVVSTITPASGPAGTSVKIIGTGFTGATAVAFDSTPSAKYIVYSSTVIAAVVPAGAVTGPVTVDNGTGVGSGPTFTVIPAPVVTSIAPASGYVGTSVTLTGTGFTGAKAVKFNGVAAPTFTVASATTITVKVPAGATTGPVTVTTPGGTSANGPVFSVTSLLVSSLSLAPSTISPGSNTKATVTLSGPAPTGGAAVTVLINGFTYRTVAVAAGTTSTSFTIAVPSATPAGAYTVTARYGTSEASAVLTIASSAPTIQSLTFAPSTIAPGSSTVGTVTLSSAVPAGVTAKIEITMFGFPISVVTIPAGKSSATFNLTADAAAMPGTYTFVAVFDSSSATATVTIN